MRILSGVFVLVLGLAVGSAVRPARVAAQGAGAQAAAPLTEADYDGIMKKVGPANAAMRRKLMGGMVMDAAADAKTLAELFGDVERFWTQRKKPDATKWAAEARKYATEAAGAAVVGDGMKAQMAADQMLGDCKQCHGSYREMDPAGGFRIKPGALTE
jgi:cytochrome c556